MLQLLAPAGSMEAVIAAVQGGADTVYIGPRLTAPGKNEGVFDSAALAQAIHYCRVRGCHTALALPELCSDATLGRVLDRALFAAREGVDAFLVRDTGLISALRQLLPDMPLWGDVRLGINSASDAAAAAAMGLKRLILAPELSLEQIAAISRAVNVETAVIVHGPVCFAHSGQCYMSALGQDHLSDSCMRCPAPCRERFSLGGRMDDKPMSMADVCLADHLEALEEAGAACAVIEGRDRRPEYVSYVTQLYSRAIRDKVLPSQEERDILRDDFSAGGLTDGYLTGETGAAMLAVPVPEEPGRAAARLFSDIRKGFMNGELRRVPVTFYVVMKPGHPAIFAAEDDRGHRAVYQGFEPVDLGRQGISDERVREILYRTGGTPYICQGVKCIIDPNMDYPDEAVEAARHDLLNQIADKSRVAPPVREGDRPERPEPFIHSGPPKLIIQITHAEQLTAELAAAGPDFLYVPAELLAAGGLALEPFQQRGAAVAAVLPRVVSEAEAPVLRELLATLHQMGIRQVVAGSMGQLLTARQAGMEVRGDLGLNVTNSWTLDRLGRAGFRSVTASFELSAREIAALAKSAPTEMIVYGRMPVMVTDHCLIRNSAGRCACSTPTSMSDIFGEIYPVEKEFGCRNIIYDGRKIFLADHPETYTGTDLWGLRFWFTTESPRECVNVVARYKAENTYTPINVGRGAYAQGAIWSE